MIKTLVAHSRFINWNRMINALLTVALLVPLVVMVPEAAPRAQPVLLEMAAERPEATVGVIVQKLVKDTSVEDLATRLGGVVTKDLHIINAFAAELPAKAVPALARAAGVRWVSLDAPVVQAGEPMDTSNLVNAYVQAIGADQLWNEDPYLHGQGVTVAVVDSGIAKHKDLKETAWRSDDDDDGTKQFRIVKSANFTNRGGDHYGHGTHIAGIIGGNGARSHGAHIGIAPKVNLVDVKISDNEGTATASEAVAGLQWVYDHKDTYGIRVVNLSLNSSVPEPYHTSPLNAAVEILWFNRIVVVVAAGNNGVEADNGILYPPANDPFVITVGATDDMGTVDIGDDVVVPYSAYGTTAEGFAKPDLVAPGANIISLLSSPASWLSEQHPRHKVTGFPGAKRYYFRMSGTSMASAVTAGAVALLLQDEPNLTPDQVKYRLMVTARPFDSPERAGAGYLDIYAAVHGTTMESANMGIEVSQLLWTDGESIIWDNLAWDNLAWDNLAWDNLAWDNLAWDNLAWDNLAWDSLNWDD